MIIIKTEDEFYVNELVKCINEFIDDNYIIADDEMIHALRLLSTQNHQPMIPDNIKEKIREKFPITENIGYGYIHSNQKGQNKKRVAAEFGYQLAQEELAKKDERINNLQKALNLACKLIRKGITKSSTTK